MQETQCDKFGVSGGLGEPRFGLKLWLGSMDRMDESSSKSWVLFRGLPYRAIVIGVDLCMFMSMEKPSRDAAPEPWRGERSLARPAAAAFVCAGGAGAGARRRRATSLSAASWHGERALSPPPFVPPAAGRGAGRGAARRGAARPGLGAAAGRKQKVKSGATRTGTVLSLSSTARLIRAAEAGL